MRGVVASYDKYVRLANAGDVDEAAGAKNDYISSLKSFLDLHKKASTKDGEYFYTAPRLTPDGILSNEEVASIIAPYQRDQFSSENQKKLKISAADDEKEIEKYKKFALSQVPDVDQSVINQLGGSWKLSDKKVYLSAIENGLSVYSNQYSTSGGGDWAADFARRSRLLETLKKMNQTKRLKVSAFRELVDDRGNRIRIYANPRKGDPSPVGDATDIKNIARAFSLMRDVSGSDKKPITVSLVSPSSFFADTLVDSEKDPNVLGFAFPRGGAHIFPDRLRRGWSKKTGDEEYDKNNSWHSVAHRSLEDMVVHTTLHEMAHVLMYEYWGTGGRDNGSDALQRDYYDFGVSGQVVSNYGKKNASEHFAEAYSRYIMTGDATPEFLALLRSRGLLKSQQNATGA
jgi:hypothetical protein